MYSLSDSRETLPANARSKKSIQGLKDYIEKHRGRLIKTTRNNTEQRNHQRKKKNNQKTKLGRKTTVWKLNVTIKRNHT